jgi:hypothetical protein
VDDDSFVGTRRRRRTTWLVLGMALGAVVASIAALLIWGIATRDTTPPLTRADLDGARALWQRRAPAGYDMDLLLGGQRPGPVHVEVRGGEVTHMTRDGVEPRQRRTWDYWSVDGMFDTLDEEFDMAENPERGFAAPPGSQAYLRAQFDPDYGYPQKYRRTLIRHSLPPLEIDWQVQRFSPVE